MDLSNYLQLVKSGGAFLRMMPVYYDFCDLCGKMLTSNRLPIQKKKCVCCELEVCIACSKYLLCKKHFDKLPKRKQTFLKIIYNIFFLPRVLLTLIAFAIFVKAVFSYSPSISMIIMGVVLLY